MGEFQPLPSELNIPQLHDPDNRTIVPSAKARSRTNRFPPDVKPFLSLAGAVQLAWAVVLHAYGAGDEITFGYECLTLRAFDPGRRDWPNKPELRTISISLDLSLNSLVIRSPSTGQETEGKAPVEGNAGMTIRICQFSNCRGDTEIDTRKLLPLTPDVSLPVFPIIITPLRWVGLWQIQ
jgi:hypothetical protein